MVRASSRLGWMVHAHTHTPVQINTSMMQRLKQSQDPVLSCLRQSQIAGLDVPTFRGALSILQHFPWVKAEAWLPRLFRPVQMIAVPRHSMDIVTLPPTLPCHEQLVLALRQARRATALT